MKQLILVRHAKSSWKHPVSDRERPLKQRGINDAVKVSKAFSTHKLSIDLIFSSPANRALSTCKLFLEQLNIPESQIQIKEDLYDFSGNSVIEFVKGLDNDLNSIMLFGHNHAFTSIVNTYGDKYIDNVPTSGLVVISFHIDEWKYITLGHTELVMFPRDYRS